MGTVDVTVAGRNHRLGCDEGQEGRLAALAGQIDERIKTIAARAGPIPEIRLMLMAALTIADELNEAREALGGRAAAPAGPLDDPARAAALAEAIDRLQAAVETVEEASDPAACERG